MNIYLTFSDLEHKQNPTVLLLYAYDCGAHEKVVSALAGFLIETCNCNVHLDLFEDQIIQERGLDDWLVDRLQEVDFIMVLCSIGARLRCTKKRVRFKSEACRRIPDYFAVAVDYVAEKMRVERTKGLPMSRFIMAYMDYSTVNDIPHQLEMGSKFCLMKDIKKLFCHLHGINGEPTKEGLEYPGINDKSYDTSELGTELHVAIESAKEFFKCNPNWVEDGIQYLPATGNKKSRHVRKSSLEPLLRDKYIIPPMETTLDQAPVDVYSQTLPRTTKETELNFVGTLQNRQNSLPSSLSSHQTLSPTQTSGSKIHESFSMSSKCNKVENLPCILCGQEGHSEEERFTCCKMRENSVTNMDDIEDETDVSSLKLKSKSMPTVYGTSIHSSQTVFQAEVHKEWGYNDGRMSASESQDSGSNKDLSLEDLEKDLQSIIMPIRHNTYHFCDNKTYNRPLSASNSGAKQNINLLFQPPKDFVSQPLKTFSKNQDHRFSDDEHVHVVQMQDIRL